MFILIKRKILFLVLTYKKNGFPIISEQAKTTVNHMINMLFITKDSKIYIVRISTSGALSLATKEKK